MSKMNRHRLLPILLPILAGLFLCPLAAQDPDMKKLELLDLPGKWWKHPLAVDELKLSPAQIERIDTIFVEHRKKLVDQKARMEKLHLDFMQVIDQPELKRAEVLQLTDQIAITRAEILRATIAMQLDIREQLTPEQRATLKKLRNMLQDEIRRHHMQKRMEGQRPGEQRPPRQRRISQ